ncbi:MAG: hypothetical protein NVS3B5_12310 [Sphingomicrobium sp.]
MIPRGNIGNGMTPHEAAAREAEEEAGVGWPGLYDSARFVSVPQAAVEWLFADGGCRRVSARGA